ncbi:hypothetical protein D3C84_1086470 [compost metagenome]
MDEETHPGHHPQHGQRQTIQRQAEGGGEFPHRHPLPQGLGVDAAHRHLGHEVEADPEGGEGRQADAADADQCRAALTEAADGEGQHQPSQQGKEESQV